MGLLKQFHYQIAGNPQGHKLVFLHGLMGSGLNWRPVAKRFEREFEILTFDQRGHGRSFHPQTGYHPRDFAHDLKNILDELGWKEIALVGHSMGGRNAMEFALHFSQRVKALVIEDIGPESSSDAIERLERLVELVPTPFHSREQARDFFLHEYPSLIAWHPQPEAVSRFLQTNIEEGSDGNYDWRFARQGIFQSMREGRNEDRWDTFRNLKMPVLVIRGEKSSDLNQEIFERMKRALPSARYEEITGAGHWVHSDQPEAFVRILREFFHTVLGTNL